MPRWTAVASRAAIESASFEEPVCASQLSDSPRCRFAAWQATLAQARGRMAIEQIDLVHRRINQLPYVADRINWGEADRWETPIEMFERGGDCEDFALTKYFALRSLGFDDAAMRIAVVWDKVDREEHAILLVEAAGSLWLLDNKIADVAPAAASADRYRLIYSLNAEGVALAPADRADTASERAPMRLTNGGRTFVLQVDPRARKARRERPL